MRTLAAAVLLAASASVAQGQAQAIQKAKQAAKATDAHIQAEQAPTRQPAATAAQKPAAQRPAPAKPQARPAVTTGAHDFGTGGKVGPGGVRKVAADTVVPTFVMREAYDYSGSGRRDPFVSLLTTNDLRPALADLHVVGILYDVSGRRSVAILRDQQNTQYRAMVGSTLGRMRVAQIKPRSVIFTIEEFGFSRQDSLVLVDTTKARTK